MTNKQINVRIAKAIDALQPICDAFQDKYELVAFSIGRMPCNEKCRLAMPEIPACPIELLRHRLAGLPLDEYLEKTRKQKSANK